MKKRISLPRVPVGARLTATELTRRFRTGSMGMVSFLDEVFNYISQVNPTLNAMTSLQRDHAIERAQKLEQKGPQPHQSLYGVPIVLKENIQKLGFPVSCGSRILEGYLGQFDATAVKALEAAGAICIGTANMDEFAMGSSTEHTVHGPVKNPHDPSKVSGGSSGGSAVACTTFYAPLALGSDTGGSVRQPAAYCGIFGFKPSYGRISRYGLVAYGSSLDQIAPFARSAEDLDVVMSVMGFQDPRDATTLPGAYVSSFQKPRSIAHTRIGVFSRLVARGLSDEVQTAYASFTQALIQAGAELVDLELDSLRHALSVYYIIACAEASSNLARFDGVRYGRRAQGCADLTDLYRKSRSEGFGQEAKLRIMLGTFALSAGYYDAFYGRAQAVRLALCREFEEAFRKCDFILLPTAPSGAFPLGEKVSGDPLQMYLNDLFTIPANLTGCCAISLPAKVSQGALPIGMQLMGRKGDDSHLISFAGELERAGQIAVTSLLEME